MISKKRFGIVGAGAIGCTLAVRLALAGHEVSILARGATLEHIQTNGVLLHDLEGEHQVNINASDNAHDLGQQDIIFLCTKAMHLSTLLPILTQLTGSDTIIIPAVNGVPWWYFQEQGGKSSLNWIESVDPNGKLSRSIDIRRILGCVVYITAETISPGVVRSINPHRLILGEPCSGASPRLSEVAAWLEYGGIQISQSGCIRDDLWTKIVANLSSNPLSVITGATLGEIYSSPQLVPLVRKLLDESLLVAASYGAHIKYNPSEIMSMGAGMGDFHTSMLQDYLKGRPLELGPIGDAVIELADRQQIAMPVTQYVLDLACFKAAHREGCRLPVC